MGGTLKLKRGIRIRADQDITVFAYNFNSNKAEGFLVLPYHALGTHYRVVSYTPSMSSLAAVVASKSCTRVSFQFTSSGNITYEGAVYTSGDILNVTLNALEGFHIAHSHDLTGTKVTSNKPIALWSGNHCVQVLGDTSSCNHVVEQMLPVDAWGTTALMTSFAGRTKGDVMRIVASEDGTDIIAGGPQIGSRNAGEEITLSIPISPFSFEVICSKPCQVVQLAKGIGSDWITGNPSMSIVPAVRHFLSSYHFIFPFDGSHTYDNYITIIINSTETNGVLLDGNALISPTWSVVLGTGYSSTAIVNLTAGEYHISHASNISFGAMVHGFAIGKSFSYPAGLALPTLSYRNCTPSSGAPGDGLDNDCDGCVDEELTNGLDEDGDGVTDEDVNSPPPTITPPLRFTQESCAMDTHPNNTGYAVANSSSLCYNHTVFFTDTVSTISNCSAYIERWWYVRDGCMNQVTNGGHSISLTKKDPVVTFPQTATIQCEDSPLHLTGTGEPVTVFSCPNNPLFVNFTDSVVSGLHCNNSVQILHRVWNVTERVCGFSTSNTQTISILQQTTRK